MQILILTLPNKVIIPIINASPQEELRTTILLKKTSIIIVIISIKTAYISLEGSCDY